MTVKRSVEITGGSSPSAGGSTVTDPAPDSDTLTYQWYEKDADGEFKPIDGATGPDFTTSVRLSSSPPGPVMVT